MPIFNTLVYMLEPRLFVTFFIKQRKGGCLDASSGLVFQTLNPNEFAGVMIQSVIVLVKLVLVVVVPSGGFCVDERIT